MKTELDDDYWTDSDFGEEKAIKIDGSSIAEQVLAGMILLAIGATGAHLYDKLSERKM